MNIAVKVFAYLILVLIAWLWMKTVPAGKRTRWILILLIVLPTLILHLLGIVGEEQAMALLISAAVSAIASFILTRALQLPWWRRILFALGQALLVVFGMTIVSIVLMVLTVMFYKVQSTVLA